MKKRILLTILALIIIGGSLAGIKVLQIRHMMEVGSKRVESPETISTAPVQQQSWESVLSAVASLDAVQGVTVAAEQPGKVVAISFTPGDFVEKGTLLAQLDTSAEEAQLRAMESSRNLARTNLRRLAELADKGLISQSEFDNAKASFKEAEAQTENIQAIIQKKNIKAPFSGRLGIRQINLGQFLKEGQEIVSLQVLDPIFVNFTLPQQELSRITKGMVVRINVDGIDKEQISGKITAIAPQVNPQTRNIQVQATVANKNEVLRPGMFVNASIVLPEQEKVFTIPDTAVLYAPYSDSVFVVEEKKDEKSGKNIKVLRQQFVRIGEKRGDFVSILSGLQGGETVASIGVFKLRNGQAVVIDNSQAPAFELKPKPENN
ncbi:MAG: efflux RND transporter periplasmic adaptor subunit [Desulfocapsaceae bacterium]|nr:efflux RND transporter periplasmic adaptor subunit [Desulfocapsaceae bacterium]